MAYQSRAHGAEKIRRLQDWARDVTSGYRGVDVRNMTTSWRDGLAFCAILHYYCPNLIDFDSLRPEDIAENNDLAFGVAEDQLGIPALLDAEDMVNYAVPDKLCVITYVSQYYAYFRNKVPGSVGDGGKSRTEGLNLLRPSTSKPKPSTSNTSLTSGAKKRDGCGVCGKKVFIVERVSREGRIFHRVCLKASLGRAESRERLEEGAKVPTVSRDESVGGVEKERRTGYVGKFDKPTPAPRKIDKEAKKETALKSGEDGREKSEVNKIGEVKKEKPNILKWLQQKSEDRDDDDKTTESKKTTTTTTTMSDWQTKQSKYLGLNADEKDLEQKNAMSTTTTTPRPPLSPSNFFTGREKALSRVREESEVDAPPPLPSSPPPSEDSPSLSSRPSASFASSSYVSASNGSYGAAASSASATPISGTRLPAPLLHSTPTTTNSAPNSLTRGAVASGAGSGGAGLKVGSLGSRRSAEGRGGGGGGGDRAATESRVSIESGGSDSTAYFTPTTTSLRSNTSQDSRLADPNRKPYKAPTPPVKKRLIRASSNWMEPSAISDELAAIDSRQEELEERGVELEKRLRRSENLEIDNNQVWAEWFTLVNEKNKLFRRETELYHTRRMQELEDLHADLEQQYRTLLLRPEASKTPGDRLAEKKILKEIVDVVEKRNHVVELVEQDRRRERAEDESIKAMMELKGLHFLLPDEPTPPASPSAPTARPRRQKISASPRSSVEASPRDSVASRTSSSSSRERRRTGRPTSYHSDGVEAASVANSDRWRSSQMSLESASKRIKTPPAVRKRRATQRKKEMEEEEERRRKEEKKREKEELKEEKRKEKELKKERKKSKGEKGEEEAGERKKKISITKKFFNLK